MHKLRKQQSCNNILSLKIYTTLWWINGKTKINAEKSKATMFITSNLRDELITGTPTYHGLAKWNIWGVVLDKKMTWKAKADHAADKGRAIVQILRLLLGRKNNFNLRNKMTRLQYDCLPHDAVLGTIFRKESEKDSDRAKQDTGDNSQRPMVCAEHNAYTEISTSRPSRK